MKERKLIADILFLKELISKAQSYPYFPPYIEIYLSEVNPVKWAINKLDYDPIKVKDFLGSVYEDHRNLYITDMPFPLYDTISLIYKIDKDKIKNILVYRNDLDEKLLSTQFNQAADFYFKQKKVYEYISNKISNIYHTVDLDSGFSFLKIIFSSYFSNNSDKIHNIFNAFNLLKEGYKSAYALDDSSLRWDSHSYEKLYVKSAFLYLYNILSQIFNILTEFNKTYTSIFKQIRIISSRLPWERKIDIQLIFPAPIYLDVVMWYKERSMSDIYLDLTIKPSNIYYKNIETILKDFPGEKSTSNNFFRLSSSSLDDLMIFIKNILKEFEKRK